MVSIYDTEYRLVGGWDWGKDEVSQQIVIRQNVLYDERRGIKVVNLVELDGIGAVIVIREIDGNEW